MLLGCHDERIQTRSCSSLGCCRQRPFDDESSPKNWQIGRDLAKASTLLELLFHLPPVGSCAAARQNEVLTSFPHVRGSVYLLPHMVEPLAVFFGVFFFFPPFNPQTRAVTVNIVSGFPRCIWIDPQPVYKQAKRERLRCLTWNMEKTSGTQGCLHGSHLKSVRHRRMFSSE